MEPREMRFSRTCGGKDAERKAPAQGFGGCSRLLDRPARMEVAGALVYVSFSAMLKCGEDAVGSILWYGIWVSLAAAERFAEITCMKKGF